MFERVYELSLNKEYVRHWGLLEAIREIIQNAIDSDKKRYFKQIRTVG